MAGPERIDHARLTALAAQLASDGPRFGFFRAVALLQQLVPERVPVGHLGPPGREAVRLAHDDRFLFAAGDVAAVTPATDDEPARLVATFLGLFGANSPLATYFAEDVLLSHDESPELRAFYDLFHHRALSLFFRAWTKYRPAWGHRTDTSDELSRRALAFVGVDPGGPAPDFGVSPHDALALAPLLALRVRPTWALEQLLERLLPGVSSRVEPFALRHVVIDADARVQLGRQRSSLGVDMTVGASVLDRAGRFRVVIGPLSRLACQALLPGGDQHASLVALLGQFARGLLEAEVELVLGASEAPRFCLGRRDLSELGRATRLATREAAATRYRFVLFGAPSALRPWLVDGPVGESLVADAEL